MFQFILTSFGSRNQPNPKNNRDGGAAATTDAAESVSSSAVSDELKEFAHRVVDAPPAAAMPVSTATGFTAGQQQQQQHRDNKNSSYLQGSFEDSRPVEDEGWQFDPCSMFLEPLGGGANNAHAGGTSSKKLEGQVERRPGGLLAGGMDASYQASIGEGAVPNHAHPPSNAKHNASFTSTFSGKPGSSARSCMTRTCMARTCDHPAVGRVSTGVGLCQRHKRSAFITLKAQAGVYSWCFYCNTVHPTEVWIGQLCWLGFVACSA